MTVAVAATQQLTATVSPAGASQAVTWSVSDATKATISPTGLVTGVAVGTAVATATSVSDPTKTVTRNITVTA